MKIAALTFVVATAFMVLLVWGVYDALAQAQQLQRPGVSSLQEGELSHSAVQNESIEFWGLTEEEWELQRTLRHRYHGLLDPALSPLEILGILAEDDAQRQRYAELYAQRQYAILRRINAFAADYAQAVQQIIHEDPLQSNRTLILVASAQCLSGGCARDIRSALQQAVTGEATLHIYVKDARDDQQIRRWATHYTVPPEMVTAHQITLNHATDNMQIGLTQQP